MFYKRKVSFDSRARTKYRQENTIVKLGFVHTADDREKENIYTAMLNQESVSVNVSIVSNLHYTKATSLSDRKSIVLFILTDGKDQRECLLSLHVNGPLCLILNGHSHSKAESTFPQTSFSHSYTQCEAAFTTVGYITYTCSMTARRVLYPFL